MSQQTYNDLIDAANNTNAIQDDTDKLVESRYSVVIASAKRARQLVAGDEVMIEANPKDKPLSIAVKELYADKLAILTDEEKEAMAELIAQKNSEVEGQKAAAALEETVEVSEEETEEE